MFTGKLIGICGKKGSGKSTLRSQIVGAEHIYFAQALKQALETMGLPPPWLYEPQHKEEPQDLLGGRTPRYAMQTLGTEWGRTLMGSHFWVKIFLQKLSQSKAHTVVCDDVRFEEEVWAVRQVRNSFLVYVATPGEVFYKPKRWWEFWKTEPHASERFNPEDEGVPVIVNDGTPEDLYKKFLSIYWPR
jgi:hypothetical protein